MGSDSQGISRVLGWGRGHLSRAKAEQLVSEARGTVGVRQSETDVLQLQKYGDLALECRREIRGSEKALKTLVQDHATIQAQAGVVGVVTACVLWVHLGDPALYDCGAAYRKANTMTKSSNVIRPATLVVTNLCDSLDKTGFCTRKPNSKQLTYYEKQGVDPELPLIDLSSFNANMRLLLDFIAAPNPL